MKNIIFILSFVVCVFHATNSMAVDDNVLPKGGTINGHVVEKSTGEGLFGANVILKGTHRGMQTKENGSFDFINLKPGTYTIQVQFLGFKTIEKVVNLTVNKAEHLHFEMEEDAIMGQEIVVTASRNEVSRQEAPVIVNVIAEKLFETVNSCDLSQSLSYQSGLRVENNCQNCGFPQVRINGLEGPYSQMLINSRPVMSALSGVYGLEQIPVNMIERVEVVKGGGSALFGSNAIAGTINVITKDPIDNSFSIGSNLASLGGDATSATVQANASLVGKENRSGMSLYQSYRHRDHWDKDGDGFSEIGLLDAHSFGLSSFLKPNTQSRLSFDYHTTNEMRRGGSQFNLQPHQTDITEQTEHIINGGGLTYDLFLNEYQHKLSAYTSLQHIARDSYYGSHQDSSAYGDTNDLTWLIGSQMVSNYKKLVFAPAILTYGLEYQQNNLKDNMPGYGRLLRQDVKIGSGFLQSEWQINHLSLLTGLRMDKHNMIERLIISPRINLRYDFSKNFQGRLTYASGFRAPQAFDEDLHITQVGGKGTIIHLSDNLKEERSNSFSASADLYHYFGRVQGNLLIEGFYTDLSNVFVLESLGEDPADGSLIMERRNGNGATVVGINLDGKLTWGAKNRYQLQMGYTFSNNQYKEAEKWSDDPTVAPTKRMTRTPKQYGYFTFTYNPFKTFKAMLSGTYTGEMKVPHLAGYIEKDVMESTPDFMDANLKISYDFTIYKDFKLQLNGGIQNLFNAFQKDLDKGIDRDSGYFYGPTQPRTFFIGLKVMS